MIKKYIVLAGILPMTNCITNTVFKFICLANRSEGFFSPAVVDADFSLVVACRFYGSNQTTAKFYSILLHSEPLRLLDAPDC